MHENCTINFFPSKTLDSFFNGHKASKEANRPNIFIKNF